MDFLNKLEKNYTKQYTQTREAWCNSIVKYLIEALKDRFGIEMVGKVPRATKISIAPISRSTKILGICYPSSASVDGKTNHIVISPCQASAHDLCFTILHQTLHALDDCIGGHRRRWKRWASTFGMKATMATWTDLNEVGRQLINDAVHSVGIPNQHTNSRQAIRTKKPASLVRLYCPVPDCGANAYVSRTQFLTKDLTPIACAVHHKILDLKEEHVEGNVEGRVMKLNYPNGIVDEKSITNYGT